MGVGRNGWQHAATLLAALALSAAAFAAQQPLVGSPPIASFKPDIEHYPQQFAIAQDGAGTVYIGGGSGTLTFDGARWALHPMPNGENTRSLAWDEGARVYFGGYDTLGWFERDATGVIALHDLTPQARGFVGKDGFADVWELHVLPEGVLFRALRDVFLLDPRSGAMRHWHHDGRFGRAWRDADGLVLQWRGEGFKRLVGDAWAPIPGGDDARLRDLVYDALPLPDGARLLNARTGGWLVLRDGKVAPAAVPRELMAPGRVSRSELLADGSFVLAGDDGMLQVWDPRGTLVHRIRLANEGLSDVVAARDGGLLVASDQTLYRLQWPTAWTSVGPEIGMRAIAHRATRWGERRIALTNTDAMLLDRDDEGELRAERLGWTEHEAWDLLPLDATHALLAESYAVRLIEGARVTKLTHDTLYPRRLVRSRFDPTVVFVGSELGFAMLRLGPRGWRLVAEQADQTTPRALEIVETAPGEVWVGTERSGALRLTLDLAQDRIVKVEPFGPAQGLAFGADKRAVVARLPDGMLIASTAAGIFRFADGRFVAEPLGGLADRRRPDQLMVLTVAPDGTLWATTEREVYRRAPHGSWQDEDVSAFQRGVIEDVGFEPDGEVAIATTGGMLFHREPGTMVVAPPPQVALTSVRLVGTGVDATVTALSLDAATPHRIPQDERAIEFRFALPELRSAGVARYRARLLGYETEFTDWTVASQYGYQALAPGAYRFEVEARDARGGVSAAAPFEFTIEPPWYATRAARALWALLALGALAIAARFVIGRRTARLAAETARLERMVKERTSELAEANRKLDTIAHLDGLTGLPNRRRLDEYLALVWAQCGERERPLAVLAIDVDRFKEYNDKHGHLAGDTLLKRLAPILTRNLRRTEDLAARYGGEEFLVVLPGADAEVARQVAEALREKVASSSIGATVSIGVAAETPRSGRGVTELVALSDAALYRAKDAGRNCVVVSGA